MLLGSPAGHLTHFLNNRTLLKISGKTHFPPFGFTVNGRSSTEIWRLFESVGSFSLTDCATAKVQCDVSTVSVGRPSRIVGHLSEHAERFVISPASTGAGSALSISDSSSNGKPVVGHPVVDLFGPGRSSAAALGSPCSIAFRIWVTSATPQSIRQRKPRHDRKPAKHCAAKVHWHTLAICENYTSFPIMVSLESIECPCRRRRFSDAN